MIYLSDQMFIEALKADKNFDFEIAEQLKRAAFDESCNQEPLLDATGRVEISR